MIDRVIMDQRSQVNQLHHGGEHHLSRSQRAGGLGRKQHHRRAKHLPLHAKQMLVHVPDDREVRSDDPPQLVQDQIEVAAYGALDAGKCHRSELEGHRYLPALARDFTRLLTSWNRMSSANTRW